MPNSILILKACRPADRLAASRHLSRRLKDACPFTSISHKNDRLVGLGSAKPCGIDIEERRTRHPSFKNFVIGSAEQNIIEDPILAWSIKEACFKIFNDGYEAADFRIVFRRQDNFTVLSEHCRYQVNILFNDRYVTAIAFVAGRRHEV